MSYHRTERSELKREATRARILAAARKLFTTKGFTATTMQDIVAEAGSSVGNLYFNFDGKGELLRVLLEGALMASWTRTAEILVETPPGPRRLAVMVFGSALGLLHHDRDLTRLISGDDSHAGVQRRLIELNTPRVLGAIVEAFPDYPAHQHDLVVAAWSGTVRHCLLLVASDQADHPPIEVAAFIVRWNLRGLGLAHDEVEDAIGYADRVFAAAGREEAVASGAGDCEGEMASG
jgi:AcrR family transcriptional regulator